ncbi:outer membrane lipoprotein carrier protein LolA [candidate division WOR-3 bacterium]|nr:outer membrane lipoprotein carrier protein LolA [candidate division WOR-3 bacterium]
MRRVIVLLVAGVCIASAASDSLWLRLRKRYLTLRTLTGEFEETICSEVEGTCRSFEGRFSIRVPSRYRLEVTEPQRQLIVSDSASLWLYLPDEKRAVKQLGGGFAPVLAFLGPVLDSTATGRVRRDSFGEYEADVTMDSDMSALGDLKLALDSSATRIKGFTFTDAWGGKYSFRLRNQRWNPRLRPGTFVFTPPKGTTIEE